VYCVIVSIGQLVLQEMSDNIDQNDEASLDTDVHPDAINDDVVELSSDKRIDDPCLAVLPVYKEVYKEYLMYVKFSGDLKVVEDISNHLDILGW
jgi:hypothetical protein